MKNNIQRLTVLGCLLIALSACSFAPLRFSVDLLERFPDEATGSFSFDAPSVTVDLLPRLGDAVTGGFNLPSPVGGITLPVALVLPSSAGQALDFRDQTLPVKLTAATLSYTIVLTSSNLSGTLQIQPYLAPTGTDAAAQEAYALGSAQTYTLGTNAVLRADVQLNEAQLEGINAQQLRLALGLSGEAGVVTAGEVSVTYIFQSLSLTVFGVTAELDELLPSPDGTLLDFSDEGITGRILDASLVYDLTLTRSADLAGDLTAQVYLAPPGEESLWQPKYAFGEPERLELGQSEIPVSGRAELSDAQKSVLDTQTLRLGVRVRGTATVPLEGAIDIHYRFNSLRLELAYALR